MPEREAAAKNDDPGMRSAVQGRNPLALSWPYTTHDCQLATGRCQRETTPGPRREAP